MAYIAIDKVVRTVANGTSHPGSVTLTVDEAWFERLNVLDPPPGILYTVELPEVLVAPPRSIRLRNNNPFAIDGNQVWGGVKIVVGDGTLSGCPEWYLCGDQTTEFWPDKPSRTDWKPINSKPSPRLAGPILSPIDFWSSSTSWVQVGNTVSSIVVPLEWQMGEFIETYVSREHVSLIVPVGGQADDLVGLRLVYWNGSAWTPVGVPSGCAAAAIAGFVDPRQMQMVPLEFLAPGGITRPLTPYRWRLEACLLDGSGPFAIGRPVDENTFAPISGSIRELSL